MTMENGVMKMRPAEGGLEIKPGETVMLKPSSAHLMFLDLKHPLEQGNAVAATLQFEKAGAAQVEFPIAANRSVSPRRGHGRHDDARRRHDADEALRLGGHEKAPVTTISRGREITTNLIAPRRAVPAAWRFRRASSRVRRCAAERRPGSSSQ
jgi:hypothetical protein